MKNSKEYTQKIQKLHRLLKRKYPKVQKPDYQTIVDALVYSIISENMSEAAARSALRKFTGYFINWNDLRVSCVEEIVEVLADDSSAAKDIASRLVKVLRAIFDKHNSLNLESLKKMGKRPARQALEKMDGTNQFVVNYCVLTALNGHAVPLTEKMIEYLKSNQLVHPDSDSQDIEGFLTRQISAENAYQFYALLRQECESDRTKKKTETKKKNHQ
jgi:endonuclease III